MPYGTTTFNLKMNLHTLRDSVSKNHPDTYHGNYPHYSSSDNGGVHTNSTVQNYWFYLLAHGVMV